MTHTTPTEAAAQRDTLLIQVQDPRLKFHEQIAAMIDATRINNNLRAWGFGAIDMPDIQSYFQ